MMKLECEIRLFDDIEHRKLFGAEVGDDLASELLEK
jgi:hypothetical protein